MRVGLEDIIRERLKMQYVQRTLYSDFGVNDADFAKITTPKFLNRFETWDIKKRKDFVYLLVGGQKTVNMAKTFKMFEDLKDKYKVVK